MSEKKVPLGIGRTRHGVGRTAARWWRAAAALALLFTAAAPGALAQVTIEGRITDPAGNGIPDADLDFFESQSGVKVDPSAPGWESQSDKTDVFGYYSMVVVPEVYDIRFEPPEDRIDLAPVIEKLVILGTDMVLDVQLPAGSRLSGRAVDIDGFPVALVDLDVHDPRKGERLPTVRDDTDANGFFATTVFPGVWDVFFRPPLGSGAGPIRVDGVDLTRDAAFDVVLPRGHTVSGVVVREEGPPIYLADLDFDDPDGNRRIPTADDATELNGTFAVNVSEGVRNVFVAPPTGLPYAPKAFYGVDISADTDLGTIVLLRGFALQGTVRDAGGAPVEGADIDVLVPGSCDRYPGTSELTDASGLFALRLEGGSYEILVTPPDGSSLPAHRFPPLTVGADLTRDFVLPATGGAAATAGGRLLDHEGQPVAEAQMRGVPAAGGTPWSAVTEADGSFTFDAAPGRYTILVEAPAESDLADLQLDSVDIPCGFPSVIRMRPITAPPSLRPDDALFGFPNPWITSTSLDLTLPQPSGNASVVVYDIMGRRIRDLHRGALPGGRTVLEWNGRDQSGNAVSSGIYLVRVTTPAASFVTKLVKL